MDQNLQWWFVQVSANPPDLSQVPEWCLALADRIGMSQRWGCHQTTPILRHEVAGVIASSSTIMDLANVLCEN